MLILPKAASAAAASAPSAPDNGPAEEPQSRSDLEAAVSRLMAMNESSQQQIQDLLSIRSGDSMSSWDNCSIGSSVSSVSQYGGGQQRVAAAGMQRLPVVPPIGMSQSQMAPPVAAGSDGQPSYADFLNEYNQFKAYQTAKALGARGRGRQPGNVAGRGAYGGRQLPPLQNPNQN